MGRNRTDVYERQLQNSQAAQTASNTQGNYTNPQQQTTKGVPGRTYPEPGFSGGAKPINPYLEGMLQPAPERQQLQNFLRMRGYGLPMQGTAPPGTFTPQQIMQPSYVKHPVRYQINPSPQQPMSTQQQLLRMHPAQMGQYFRQMSSALQPTPPQPVTMDDVRQMAGERPWKALEYPRTETPRIPDLVNAYGFRRRFGL